MAKKDNKKGPQAPRSIQNRRARYDFAIIEEYTAGIALLGSEVKSLYLGQGSLTDAFCKVVNGEMFLINMDIDPYEKATVFAHDRRRDRKLLLNRREINVIERKSMEKGLTIVPLSAFFSDKGKVKIHLALARGKAEYDKRKQIAKDDERREIERARNNRD